MDGDDQLDMVEEAGEGLGVLGVDVDRGEVRLIGRVEHAVVRRAGELGGSRRDHVGRRFHPSAVERHEPDATAELDLFDDVVTGEGGGEGIHGVAWSASAGCEVGGAGSSGVGLSFRHHT